MTSLETTHVVTRLQLTDFPAGTRSRIRLEFDSEAGRSAVPVLLLRGALPGRTLVVTAGVHGDEFEGVQTILQLDRRLDPMRMCGNLLAVPVANPAAFRAVSRTNPQDYKDLARTFPGRKNGTATEALAHTLAENVIRHADLYVDLHSGGLRLSMPTLIGYDCRDTRSTAAARAFGSEILWAHETEGIGRTVSFAASQNIPWLYTEAAGMCRVAPADVAVFERGLMSMMHHLEIWPEPPAEGPPARVQLYGDGDLDFGVHASQPGFFAAEVRLLTRVSAGDRIGLVRSLYGEVLEVCRAPRDGVVAALRGLPVVEAGDMLCHLAAGMAEEQA